MYWNLKSTDIVKSIPQLADSLSETMKGLSDIKVISFDQLVSNNIRNDCLPSSADCLFVGRRVTFVEFKGWVKSSDHENDEETQKLIGRMDKLKRMELERSIQLKAADSLILYNEFLSHIDKRKGNEVYPCG